MRVCTVLMCRKQNLLSVAHGALACGLCCGRSGNGANLGGSPGHRPCGGFSTPVPTQSLRSKTEGPSGGRQLPLSFRQTTTAKSSRSRQLLSAFALVSGEGRTGVCWAGLGLGL